MLKYATTNKPILVLILGCLPLAGLTVASFAGIGNLASQLPSLEDGDLVPPGTDLSVPSTQDLQDDELLRTAVTEREFLAGEPLPDRAAEAKPLYWDTLAANWKQWSNANDLVDDVLSLEEDLIGAELAQLKSAVRHIETIQDECRKKDPAGSARLARILERRKADLRNEIAYLEECGVVENLVAQAKAAYDNGDFFQSVKIYQTVLESHKKVLSPEMLENLTAARRNAEFWRDAGYLRLMSPVTEQPSKQQELLVGFLDSYQGMEGDGERKKIEAAEKKLVAVREELHRIALNKAAVQPISTLGRYDGRPFGEGLSAAARIAETYPTEWVRSQLQERAVVWLTQLLPPKHLNEPADLQEVETNSGTIIRGYFEPVDDAAGGVIGYKRYPSAAERETPTRTVGRYPAADLRGVPNRSVPRQCVEAYNAARSRLLADPGNRDCWNSFRRTCDSAEAALVDYRRKPGSSGEDLYFEDVRQFARNVLNSGLWTEMEVIWSK